MARQPGMLSGDLFARYEAPSAVAELPGALAFGPQLRGLLNEAIKHSPRGRAEIAARMSELTGQEITVHQINAWTAESRDGWRFPLEFLAAFEVACATHGITAWHVNIRGGQLLVGREALNAEIGRLERSRDMASRRLRELKKLAAGDA